MILRSENIGYTWKSRGVEFRALNSFTGEFSSATPHVICGPSGSGKSTLGFLLAGLMPPDTGNVLLDGDDVSSRRENIAYVFQFAENIFFEDSIRDELNALSRGNGSLDLSYFEKLGIDFASVENKAPFHLSAGYGRLVATAMQLARNPQVLILDEPTIGLDDDFEQRMIEILKQWSSPDHLLIVITHDLNVMRELGGQSWVLNHGQLAWHGVTGDLLSNESLLKEQALLA